MFKPGPGLIFSDGGKASYRQSDTVGSDGTFDDSIRSSPALECQSLPQGPPHGQVCGQSSHNALAKSW